MASGRVPGGSGRHNPSCDNLSEGGPDTKLGETPQRTREVLPYLPSTQSLKTSRRRIRTSKSTNSHNHPPPITPFVSFLYSRTEPELPDGPRQDEAPTPLLDSVHFRNHRDLGSLGLSRGTVVGGVGLVLGTDSRTKTLTPVRDDKSPPGVPTRTEGGLSRDKESPEWH